MSGYLPEMFAAIRAYQTYHDTCEYRYQADVRVSILGELQAERWSRDEQGMQDGVLEQALRSLHQEGVSAEKYNNNTIITLEKEGCLFVEFWRNSPHYINILHFVCYDSYPLLPDTETETTLDIWQRTDSFKRLQESFEFGRMNWFRFMPWFNELPVGVITELNAKLWGAKIRATPNKELYAVIQLYCKHPSDVGAIYSRGIKELRAASTAFRVLTTQVERKGEKGKK